MGKILKDAVFTAVKDAQDAKAIHGDKVIDVTLGALYDEDGVMVAMDSVYDVYNGISNFQKAKYASSLQGNIEFREAVKKWLGLPDALVVATPGGSGAVAVTFRNSLRYGDTVLFPSVCWGPYKIMAVDQNIEYDFYEMFDGDSFNVKSFMTKTTELMDKQGRVTCVINDPAHNPTGYSMSYDEWVQVMKHLNKLAEKGRIALLNDVAYIDYTKDDANSRKHFELFKNLHKNLLVVTAFSISKTLTAYGLRVGASVILGDQAEDFKNECVHTARAIWSNINNSGQVLFSELIDKPELKMRYLKEKAKYVEMLKARSDLFLSEAKEVGLEIYPHKEGFFATVKVDPEICNKVHAKLNEELIFTINLPNGPRIALCSAPLRKVEGLAKKIKDVINLY